MSDMGGSAGEEQHPTEVDAGRPDHHYRRAELAEPLLRPGDVAALFHVDPRTVTRWARSGKLTTIRTVGGHRRYRLSEVMAMRNESTAEHAEERER
jgi:excisionase family DNA binding protein